MLEKLPVPLLMEAFHENVLSPLVAEVLLPIERNCPLVSKVPYPGMVVTDFINPESYLSVKLIGGLNNFAVDASVPTLTPPK
jgi:hypothetical protein